MALVFERGVSLPKKVTVDESKMDEFSVKTYAYLKKFLGYHEAQSIWLAGQRIVNLEDRTMFYAKAVIECEREVHGNAVSVDRLSAFAEYRWKPVGVREFVCSPQYMNKEAEVYPKVLEELEEINSGKYVEAVLTGGIGSAKTTSALYTTSYQLYLLSCMRSPHATFKLDASSEILMIFQSINARLAKNVDFARFKSMIEGCRYFTERFSFDKHVESRLVFPNRIEVVPVSGAETAAIGQNVIGGVIDELNYMSVVEKSKQSVDKGTFDQAVALYNSIARRRKSRFMEQGKMPGILCLVSSKKYPGQFTDQKEEEAKTDPTIYVYDKRVWDIKPEGTFTKGWFQVFAGDMTRKPRVLDEGEEVSDEDRTLVISVPTDFREDFKKDIINALREIAGISTLARHPYFMEVDRVQESFGHHESIFGEMTAVDFVETRVTIHKKNFVRPELPRFAHVDLAISGDSAGVAIGTVMDFVSMEQLGRGSEIGLMPMFHIDGVLEVVPPRNSEILFFKIRELFVTLRKMGLNIRWITYDSFESTDSQQLLRQQGFVTGYQSVDIVPCKPYDFTKSAIYDGRVKQPLHPHLHKEILMLERDLKTSKVDHPPGGSKDCADGLAGVVYGLTMRREVWGMYKVPLALIPPSVTAGVDKLEEKNDRLAQDIEKSIDKNPGERVRMRGRS